MKKGPYEGGGCKVNSSILLPVSYYPPEEQAAVAILQECPERRMEMKDLREMVGKAPKCNPRRVYASILELWKAGRFNIEGKYVVLRDHPEGHQHDIDVF